ncbi:dihydrolipoyl dehydrogenase family protein [Winogradskyella arenosi]|uniref:Glutathione reductase (NADPH) n=1 Tax=Winogradskyella arenosi TaxID=533325 RepID=A0A368ZIR9_9FLAO|nr:NAD(P)/FAD-dependent oxidoreductase [Winogradskyella arenosi]RCW93679.1 glutathione reductase (NADPH) [Winogradskyella arenosi]
METIYYDVFVIGSGIAGQTAAKACTKKGLKVAIADNRIYGGTCAIRGCDPKKVLMQFADLMQKSSQLKDLGVTEVPKIDWKTVQKFKTFFTQPVPLATEEDLSQLGIDLYHQSPKFISKNEVLVEGKTITADKFVIATGLLPRPLNIKGSNLLKTSDALLNMKSIPNSAVFIGSGYVGMEFSYMLAAMGCKVTLIELSDQPLAPFDAFLVDKLVKVLEKMGITFIFQAKPLAIEKLKKNVKLTYEKDGEEFTLKARKIFNTSGRVPAIKKLDVEQADIKADATGIIVNDYMQSTSHSHVYACGDVSSKSLPLTPLSGLQGYIAGHNIVNGNTKTFEDPLVPSIVFTHPQLAMVGYSEAEAKSRYKNIKVYKGDASKWYNAKKENAEVYAYKILVNERTDTIVGAHLLSNQANETINILTMAINTGMTVTEFKKQIFTYPSYSNDLKSMLKDKD